MSFYLTEVNLNFHILDEFRPNNLVCVNSFGSNPIDYATIGATQNTHRFLGNEQLQLNWKSDMNLGNNLVYQVEVFAYVQSVIECSATYVKKGSIN